MHVWGRARAPPGARPQTLEQDASRGLNYSSESMYPLRAGRSFVSERRDRDAPRRPACCELRQVARVEFRDVIREKRALGFRQHRQGEILGFLYQLLQPRTAAMQSRFDGRNTSLDDTTDFLQRVA